MASSSNNTPITPQLDDTPADTSTVRRKPRRAMRKGLSVYTEIPSEKVTRLMSLVNFRLLTKQNPQELDVGGSKRLLLMKVSLNKDESSAEQDAGAGKEPETVEDSETDTSKESFLHMVMVKKQTDRAVFVSLRVKLFNRNYSVVLEKKISHLFSNLAEEELILPEFIDTDNLEDDCIDVDDTLRLYFDFTICDSEPIHTDWEHHTSAGFENKHKRTLLKDLEDLLKEGKGSDVTLRIGDATFLAHKAILAARSPRFSKIVEDLKKERVDKKSKTEEVEIIDVDANTMKLLLQFIYTEKLENMDYVQSLSLYSAAVKYQMSALRLRCAKILRKNLSAQQVHRVLLVAEELADSELKKVALDFLCEHNQSVILTSEWQAFLVEHEELANKALKHLQLKVDD